MSFARRFQNSFGTATTTNPQTLFSVQLFQHETLVVFLVHTSGIPSSVVWNGLNLTLAVRKTHGSANVDGSIWILEDSPFAPFGTSDVVINFLFLPTRITATLWTVLPTRAPLTLDRTASNDGITTDTTASTGTTPALTYPGEFSFGMLGVASGLGSANVGNGFTDQGSQHSGGATDNVTVLSAYKLNEYGTTGLECTWGPLAVNWVAMIITLKEGPPPETQSSEVIEDLEYSDVRIQEAQLQSLLESTDQEIHIPQLVSLLEYRFADIPESEVDCSQVVETLEYYRPSPINNEVIDSQNVSILEYHPGQTSGCYQTLTISDAEARRPRTNCN